MPIVAIVMVLYSMHFASTTLDRDRLDTAIANELKARVAIAHAVFEDYMGGDEEVDLQRDVHTNLDQAARLCTVMRDGGNTSGAVRSMSDRVGRTVTTALCAGLHEFRKLVNSRIKVRGKAALDDDLDEAYDRKFHEIIQRTDAIITALHGIAARNRRILNALDLTVALLLGGFMIVMAVSVRRHLVERAGTSLALQDANTKLAAQIDALEQRSREIHLLTEMGSLFEACTTPEEAFTVISQFAGRLFPDESGALHVISPSRDTVERVASWGEGLASERGIRPGRLLGSKTWTSVPDRESSGRHHLPASLLSTDRRLRVHSPHGSGGDPWAHVHAVAPTRGMVVAIKEEHRHGSRGARRVGPF